MCLKSFTTVALTAMACQASCGEIHRQGHGLSIGEVIEEVDGNGYFVVQDNYSDDEVLCLILNYHDAPSLYRGSLKSLFF